MSSVVSPLDTVRITHGALTRQLLSRGRLVTLALLAIVMVAVAAVVGANVDGTNIEQLEAGADLVTILGLGVVVPIASLVFGGASLGDPRDDATLVYLWLRPMGRGGVVVGAFLASVTVALPFSLVAMGASALVLGQGSDLVVATLLASGLAVLAYCAIFVLVGLLVRNSVVWGLLYVMLWEGIVAQAGSVPARLAIRGYSRSILGDRLGIELASNDVSSPFAIVMLLVITIAGLLLATWRLQSMNID
jgi:ABC-2 type transport system permease protein